MLIDKLLSSPVLGILARVLVTFVFWSSGLAKLFDFAGAVAEMEKYGVLPAAPMAALVIMVQLGGSALVISGWNVWLGAGALGVFTALTIPVAHAFWTMTGEAAFFEMLFAIEHISVIGGLMVVAILRRPVSAEVGRLAKA
ncbi:DoxX family protein [Rhizobium sp. BE258]|jgi:transmembrane protein|uniref:DoxX family protein n=1 Tax=Rhizobium sp. BE258 TaxID=2817722 RepID=UPI00285CF4F4|nr:DoxX family protein [Rhizobium sp. BE258]MDR7145818.1 transmembrane protein [Rhizobium sp. BE258]